MQAYGKLYKIFFIIRNKKSKRGRDETQTP